MGTGEHPDVRRSRFRAWAREERGDHDTESRETGTPQRSRRTWLVAAAAVLLIAGAAVVGLTERGGEPTIPATLEGSRTTLRLQLSADTGAQRCMVPNASVLGRADVAFDGEVAAISDGRVRLVPRQFYAGGPADEVVVTQADASMRDLVGAVQFEERGRYLVAASDRRVMVCGLSGAYGAALARLYAEAFAS